MTIKAINLNYEAYLRTVKELGVIAIDQYYFD